MPLVKPAVPQESLLDRPLRAGSALAALLLREYASARLSLALAPKRVLPREATRTWNLDAAADAQRLQQVAGAYEVASHLVGAHDQCLAWSLAVMRLCRRRRDPVACVIGVSFRPFSAHCWVQSKDSLINDRYDKVRNFTPILVL